MALTLSGTNGVVGAGFTVDASGVSVTAGVGTFSSVQGSGANLTSLYITSLRADPTSDNEGGNLHRIETSTKGRVQLLTDI